MNKILSEPELFDARQLPDPTAGPLAGYRALVAGGAFAADPAQALAAEALERLHRALSQAAPARGVGRLFAKSAATPRGVYLHGAVGRGKTMLMDLFFRDAAIEPKRRVHFHQFMTEVHGRIHHWRRGGGPKRERGRADPIAPLARALAGEARLLCFDEFEVRDVADALILRRLFSALLDHGVVVVATSNRAPEELYQGGLQRDRFLPFIELLRRRLEVVGLEHGADYRLQGLRRLGTYFCPLGLDADARLEAALARIAGSQALAPVAIEVNGRRLDFLAAGARVLCASFDDLCRQPLGAADYLALAARFQALALTEVPLLAAEQRNQAQRLASLIDILYDHGVKLICSADGPPESLYKEGTGAFEFKRAVSRLNEMQTDGYLGRPHRS